MRNLHFRIQDKYEKEGVDLLREWEHLVEKWQTWAITEDLH